MLSKSDRQFILSAIKESRDSLKQELKEEFKEELTQHKDVIIGRLDNIDQELAVIGGHRDELEDHDARIATLEKIHPQGKHAIKTI